MLSRRWLSRRVQTVRGRPGPALGAFAVGLLLGFVLALATGGGSGSTPARAGTSTGGAPLGGTRSGAGATPGGTSGVADATRVPIAAALVRAVADAERTYGGSAEVAVWLPGWSAPVLVGNRARAMRMWSMSKAVTAIAVYQALPAPPSAELSSALVDALTRSDNCAQRRVILGLQALRNGLDPAREAFEGVLRAAGARALVPPQTAAPDPICLPYLTSHTTSDVGPATTPTYQYGIAAWTVLDAIRFAYALGNGLYGAAGRHVLALLREPKQLGPEATAQTFTTNVAWGAGRAFARWNPAYKAGWGGHEQGAFLVGQIAVLRFPRGCAAVAVMYHPPRQPTADDPGQQHAADALEAIERELATAFARVEVGG